MTLEKLEILKSEYTTSKKEYLFWSDKTNVEAAYYDAKKTTDREKYSYANWCYASDIKKANKSRYEVKKYMYYSALNKFEKAKALKRVRES